MQWPYCVCDSQHVSSKHSHYPPHFILLRILPTITQHLHHSWDLLDCLVGWGWGWVLNEAMETRYAVVPYSMFIVQEYTIESLNYAIYLPIGIALEKWPTDMPRMPRHFITIPNVAHYWLPLADLLWLGEFHDGISLNNLITGPECPLQIRGG